MRKIVLNLALFALVVLLAMGYVRWGGDSGSAAVKSRANLAYKLVIAFCVVSCGFTFLRKSKR